MVQRTVVRMLYDAGFARAVYADRDTALAGLELTRAERDALVRPDPRAYATDPYRRARALHGLLVEFPASSWLASRATRDVRALDGFFSGPQFHDCIATRGSLAAAFGAYLQRAPLGDGRIRGLAQLEAAIACVRRAPSQGSIHRPAAAPEPRQERAFRPARAPELRPAHRSGGDLLVLSPRHAVIELPSGAAALYEAVASHVRTGGDDVGAFLLQDSTPGSRFDMPFEPAAREFLHIASTSVGDVAIAVATAELADLLQFACEVRTRTALASRACALGADPDEAGAVIEDLLHEGILLRLE